MSREGSCGSVGAAHAVRRRAGAARYHVVHVAVIARRSRLAVLSLAAAASTGGPRSASGACAPRRRLAADVAALDAQIDAAVLRYARPPIHSPRCAISDNSAFSARRCELDVARATLAARAVALYKHDDVTTLDAILTADDFSDLVGRLTMVQSIARGDRDVVRTVERTKRELTDRAVSLVADERTAKKLVAQRRRRAQEHQGAARERRGDARGSATGDPRPRRPAAASYAHARRDRQATVGAASAASGGGGQGQWWPLIQEAAGANGVSARGMYRLMTIESGGYASIVGPGGYYGLFQYPPHHLEGLLEPLSCGRHHRRRRADPRHGARPQDGVRARLVGPVVLLGVLGQVTRPLLMLDHDGVVVDSFEIFTSSFVEACRRVGLPQIATTDDVLALFGDNFYESLRGAGADDAQIREAMRRTADVLRLAMSALRPFPLMPEVLADLAEARHLVIVSSNAGDVVELFLKRHGIAGVAEVAGAEAGRSKVAKVEALIARFPGQANYWFVGDTAGDMREARLAGARPLGVAWGWHEPGTCSRRPAPSASPTRRPTCWPSSRPNWPPTFWGPASRHPQGRRWAAAARWPVCGRRSRESRRHRGRRLRRRRPAAGPGPCRRRRRR